MVESLSDFTGLLGPEGIHALSIRSSPACFNDEQSALAVVAILSDAAQGPLELLCRVVLVLEADVRLCDLQKTDVDYSALVIDVLDLELFEGQVRLSCCGAGSGHQRIRRTCSSNRLR